MTDESRRKFIKQILAGTAAVATSGLANVVLGKGRTEEEKIRPVIACLKDQDGARIRKYASQGFATGMVAKLDVDFVDTRKGKTLCGITLGVDTRREFSSQQLPHMVYLGEDLVLMGKECARFHDAYVALRNIFVKGYVDDLKKAVATGNYEFDTRTRDPIFVPNTKGYLSIVEKKDIAGQKVNFVYTMIDGNGDGTPNKLTVIQEYKGSSRAVLYTVNDPNFVGTKNDPGLYDGLFEDVYQQVRSQKGVKTKKPISNDKALEKELERTLDKALEGNDQNTLIFYYKK